MSNKIHVAVGVIINAERQVLISRRADEAHQGGLWEFPGGKVEIGETVQQALLRELREELGLDVLACEPLTVIEHDYGDKHVVLDTWLVSEFTGDPKGLEGQPVEWVSSQQLVNYQFPKANRPILEKIQQSVISEKDVQN